VNTNPTAPTIPNANAINNVTLTVQNPINGVVYRWYNSNTEVFDPNTTYVGTSRVVNLSATGGCNNVTYYVSAFTGCESARTLVTAQVCPENQAYYSNSATIWGYANTLPIAEVGNAKQSEIAYTSFESVSTAETPTWTHTGNRAGSSASPGRTGMYYYLFTGSNPVSKNNLPAGQYRLSYWASGSITITLTNATRISLPAGETINGWTYYEHTINASNTSAITVSLSGVNGRKLDEVRLYPTRALMTTSTYDPLVGITSKTDANNLSEFYEYDDFGRKTLTKDHNLNIIQQTIYHYKGQ
jgi:hypothetical protein